MTSVGQWQHSVAVDVTSIAPPTIKGQALLRSVLTPLVNESAGPPFYGASFVGIFMPSFSSRHLAVYRRSPATGTSDAVTTAKAWYAARAVSQAPLRLMATARR